MGRISMPQGKGSQLHNRRDYEKIGREIPDNINSLMTHENVTIVDKDIRSAYREIFGEVLQEYNAKQKRSDRKIDDYYEHILKSKMVKNHSTKMYFNGDVWKTSGQSHS